MGSAYAGARHQTGRADENTRLGQALRDCQLQLEEERLAHARARSELAYFREIIDALPAPIFAKDAALRFVFFNRAYEAFFGIERDDYLGKTVLELGFLPESQRQSYQQEDAEMLRTGGMAIHEKVFGLPGGETRTAMYWSQGILDAQQHALGLIGMIVDITEQQAEHQSLSQKFEQLVQAHEQARTLSLTDELTGLANRRAATLRLQALITQAELGCRDGLSVIMFDLDHFKAINDTHGHDAGDLVLQGFAEIMRSTCRQTDTVARLGGEEFLCLLPGAQAATALQVAERIRNALSELAASPGPVRCSAGIASIGPGDTAATLIKRADSALYRAKQTGRNRSLVF
ncbi:GGDEF domain-containing protein [Crenobacter caeni]|uniref:diguanylate cyclase n=1 Tax=Crenobacter caeni TaxID=2705474 RepID=A0A6B2KMK4_9NEIS|nr:GGDEF domain-containing protein [Crenobacter caeni]NDV11405.1 diguanylate cyclase [Crenobacter caeni]